MFKTSLKAKFTPLQRGRLMNIFCPLKETASSSHLFEQGIFSLDQKPHFKINARSQVPFFGFLNCMAVG